MELSRSLEKTHPIRSSEPSEPKIDKPLYRNRAFMWILSGNLISVFGDCFSGVALSLWVLQTTGSAKQMAAVQICYMAVSILLGSFAGTVADRLDRRKLMLLSDLLRGSIALTLGICLFFLETPFFIMLILISLSAFCSLFQAPAFHASVTHLVGKERIQQATSLIHLTDNIARITGLALAGVVVATFGGFAAMLSNSVTFFVSAACVLAAGIFPAFSKLLSHSEVKTSFLQEWRQGLAFILRDPLTRSIVILNPLLIMFFMSSLMLIQVMVIKEWKAGPVAFGLIEMCVPLGYMMGAGLILGFSRKLGRRGWWVFTGLICLGPIFYFISIMESAQTALPFILSAGILFAFCTMIIQIILRTEVRVEMQGRIYGFMGAITSVAPAFGLAISAVLADHFGVEAILGWQGLILLGVGIVACLLLKPIRTYK